MSWLRRAERAAWVIGVLLVALWAAAKIHSAVGSKKDLERFHEARAARPTAPAAGMARALPGETPPDYSLWSKERIKAYEDSLRQKSTDPLGVLRIRKIGLEVAVLEGTDDFTLNRAVGHIEDTARPGERGNVGIAGHRDGFFRGLKDVVKGDTMELETLSGTETYRVADIWIVKPEDVQVLDPTPEPALTLVACYPFYFVGHAPQRYIVRAVRESAVPASATR
ncbi:MAG TPA: class D sortase [Thermoanaerobaculia bacterium]|nr:class D sortase [Thermoanaerobaculia bacterium]